MDPVSEIDTNFNPRHAYGNYLLISEPNADNAVISKAKALLQEQVNHLVPQELQCRITWEVNPEHQQYNPETFSYITCTSVAWRYTPT